MIFIDVINMVKVHCWQFTSTCVITSVILVDWDKNQSSSSAKCWTTETLSSSGEYFWLCVKTCVYNKRFLQIYWLLWNSSRTSVSFSLGPVSKGKHFKRTKTTGSRGHVGAAILIRTHGPIKDGFSAQTFQQNIWTDATSACLQSQASWKERWSELI